MWSPKSTVYLYQLGDHDPSGVDAWRAFRERVVGFLGKTVTAEMIETARQWGTARYLELGKPLGVQETEPDEDYCRCEDTCNCWDSQVSYLFIGDDREPRKVTFARLAVTEDHIRDLNLPTRPTKQTDSRAHGFEGGIGRSRRHPADRAAADRL